MKNNLVKSKCRQTVKRDWRWFAEIRLCGAIPMVKVGEQLRYTAKNGKRGSRL